MSGAITNGVVQQVDSKAVNTKFGSKPTFSFQVDGQWFKTGFTRHGLNAGDVVSFNFNDGTYGKEVDAKAITKGGVGGAAPGPALGLSAVGRDMVLGKPPTSYGNKGVFPIPALDGQRSIVRQNALTNAREVVVARMISQKSFGVLMDDTVADAIIVLARRFEAYTTGDIDAAEVAAEMRAEAAGAADELKKAA